MVEGMSRYDGQSFQGGHTVTAEDARSSSLWCEIECEIQTLHVVTHLENLFNILPAGVTSKNDMGDLNIAVAIRSWSFRDAWQILSALLSQISYLNRQTVLASIEQNIQRM